MTEKEAMALIYASPYMWFTHYAKIETKDGQMLTPKASKFQVNIFKAYEWLVSRNLPVRIIAAPKARQSYGSTAVGALCYHHTRRTKCSAMVMADETSRVEKLWTMLRRFAEHDLFAELWDSKLEFNSEKGRLHFTDANKRKRFSEWEKETATDAAAGAAGTRQCLWFSECMRYSREGDASDTKVIGNALGSMPNNPGTAVFLESTAETPDGYAYNIWKEAVTLDERMAGKMGNGWVKVFCAWHECDDYVLDPNRDDCKQWFDDDDPRFALYRDREEAGRKLYGWTPAQVAWRRWKLFSELDGSQTLLDRDFPESEASAFSGAGSPRFHPVGVANLMKVAEAGHTLARKGSLETNAGQVRFIDDPVNGWLWYKEPPTVGTKVCITVDPATGEQSVGSKNRDCHSVLVLREAYYDGGNVLHPTEVVAAIDIPGGCRWDLDFLADKIATMSRHWDNCIVVSEANNSGIALIAELRALGVHLWQREQIDHITPGKRHKVFGWRTDTKSREMVVEKLAKSIRESSGTTADMELICAYKPVCEELSTFIRLDSGRSEASSGHHDDHVMSLGIGLTVNTFSTITPPPSAAMRRSGASRGGVSAACS